MDISKILNFRRVLMPLCLIALLGLCSCSFDASKIENVEIEKVQTTVGVENFALNIRLSLTNNNRSAKLKKAVACGYLDGKKVFDVEIADTPIKIKRGDNTIVLPIKIKFTTKQGVLGLMSLYRKLDQIKLDVNVKGGTSLMSKEIEYKQMPLSQIAELLGIDLKKDLFKL